MPLISIVIPVYNVERYVSLCLDSLRAQTFSDIEIICVVDGALDRSESVVRMHEALDERVRVISKENGGVSSARNAGIRAASGKYIMFVDPDDCLDKNACKVVFDTFQKTDAEVVTFGAQCLPAFDGNVWLAKCLSTRDVVYDGFDPALLFEENSHPYIWRSAVKKELLLRESIFFNEAIRFGEDEVFHFLLYPLSKKTVLISDCLYYYRVIRDDSLMSSVAHDRILKVKRHLKIASAIFADWKQRGLLDKYPEHMLDWLLEFVLFDIHCVQIFEDRESCGLRDELNEASDALLTLVFDVAPELRDAGLSMGGIDAKIVLSMQESREKGVSWRCTKELADGFAKRLAGSKAYYKQKLGDRLAAFKRALKGVLPLPASSMQEYMMENVERERIERELSDSLQLIQIEYDSKFGLKAAGFESR